MGKSTWHDFVFEQWLAYVQEFNPQLLEGLRLQELPASEGKFAESGFITQNFDPEIAIALQDASIPRLFLHQAQAVTEVRKGNDVLVATGTNSGKSLCYHLPLLEILAREPHARGIYIYPTKALALAARFHLSLIKPQHFFLNMQSNKLNL